MEANRNRMEEFRSARISDERGFLQFQGSIKKEPKLCYTKNRNKFLLPADVFYFPPVRGESNSLIYFGLLVRLYLRANIFRM